jgi:DNA repair protein RecO (recombination protein O)
MSRTAIYSALVLRNRPSGEANSEVSLLTAEEGSIRATVFGGAKSKLRAHSAPYNSGQVWVYRDPAKEYGKLSDFDVRSWRPGLRELYERTMAAAAVADTVLSSHGGGGEWSSALKLTEAVLDALESANEELCSRLFVHFLWRWAALLGFHPEEDTFLNLGPGARRWLETTAQLAPNELHRYSMDTRSFSEAKALTTALMTNALGKRLSSWDW